MHEAGTDHTVDLAEANNMSVQRSTDSELVSMNYVLSLNLDSGFTVCRGIKGFRTGRIG